MLFEPTSPAMQQASLHIPPQPRRGLVQIVSELRAAVDTGDITLPDLLERGFPVEVVQALGTLTQRSRESRVAFVHRVAEHPVARDVELSAIEARLHATRRPTTIDRWAWATLRQATQSLPAG